VKSRVVKIWMIRLIILQIVYVSICICPLLNIFKCHQYEFEELDSSCNMSASWLINDLWNFFYLEGTILFIIKHIILHYVTKPTILRDFCYQQISFTRMQVCRMKMKLDRYILWNSAQKQLCSIDFLLLLLLNN